MAYGNCYGTAYKNGQRQYNREDNTPYKEDEVTPGYWQAFEAALHKEVKPHHVTLGNGPIRLCGYKDNPVLYWEGNPVDLTPYQQGKNAGTNEWDYYESEGYKGEMHGYKFQAVWYPNPSSHVSLSLIEPDGTEWTGEAGYYLEF